MRYSPTVRDSRARGIPLPDGTPGPQPLRTEEQLLGMTGLFYADQTKVDGANALYEVLGKFVEELHKKNIPWSLEIWQHEKETLLVSDATLFSTLERFCPGDHEDEPWGFDQATSTFNTAKEAGYPDGMCQTYAEILQRIIQAKGIRAEDFSAKSSAAALQTQSEAVAFLKSCPSLCGPKGSWSSICLVLTTRSALYNHAVTFQLDVKCCELKQTRGKLETGACAFQGVTVVCNSLSKSPSKCGTRMMNSRICLTPS